MHMLICDLTYTGELMAALLVCVTILVCLEKVNRDGMSIKNQLIGCSGQKCFTIAPTYTILLLASYMPPRCLYTSSVYKNMLLPWTLEPSGAICDESTSYEMKTYARQNFDLCLVSRAVCVSTLL